MSSECADLAVTVDSVSYVLLQFGVRPEGNYTFKAASGTCNLAEEGGGSVHGGPALRVVNGTAYAVLPPQSRQALLNVSKCVRP